MALWYIGPNPTVDLVQIRLDRPLPEVLLVRRKIAPFIGKWAFPGGFLDPKVVLTSAPTVPTYFIAAETPIQAAIREYIEETGDTTSSEHPLVYVGTYTGPGRDPRETQERWTTTTAYAFINHNPPSNFTPQEREILDVDWHPITPNLLAEMAFDHARILTDALTVLGIPLAILGL